MDKKVYNRNAGKGKNIGKNTKASYKRLHEKELAKRLNTDIKTLHREIKEAIVNQHSSLLKSKNVRNPDICIDENENIVLKHPTKNIYIETNTPLDSYKE